MVRLLGCGLVATVLVACGGGGGSGSSGSSTAPPSSAAVAPGRERVGPVRRDGDTYRVPSGASGAPGTLVAASRRRSTEAFAGARQWVVLYRSSDAAGRPTTVSGTVLVPTGTPPRGGWPVLSWAHGTVGVADRCAPSRTANLSYNEYAQEARAALDAGYAVVATDYVGLGTPGPHPYLDGVGEGNAVVDIVTAAHRLVSDLAQRWFAVGHSQGGQAVLFASRLAARRDPDHPLGATVAIAPASHLELLVPAVAAGGQPGDYVYALYALAGLAAVDPSVRLAGLLGPEGRSRLDLITRDGCLLDTAEVFRSVPATGTFDLGPERMREVSDGLARMGNPDRSRTAGPVLVVQGVTDADVPAALSAETADRLRSLGADVTYREYPGLGHDQVLGPSFCDRLAFLAAHGGRPVDGCVPVPTDLS